MSFLTQLGDEVRKAAAAAGPSVVGIGHRRAQGSGVVVAPGRIVTNAHNLGPQTVTVTFADGRTAEAEPLGVDVDGDLAVLGCDTGDAPAIGASPDGAPEIGTPVFALSNPGGRGPRVSFGIVSATQRSFRGPRGRRITGSLEHTAPLLPGSSGGPVTDADGRLLGINTNRLGEGFYLAIPADASLLARIDSLGRGESPGRRQLGVAVAPPHVTRGLRRAVGLPEVDGLLVRGVSEGSPAEAAGIREGDVLLRADGRDLSDPDDLADALAASDGPVGLDVLRGTEEIAIAVTPTEG